MAQFDSSMYRGVPAIDLSQATEGFERGMKLGDMVRQRKSDALMKEAYQQGVTQNPDGSTTFNAMKVGDFLNQNGMARESQEFIAKQQQKDLEQQKLNFEKQSTKILGGYQLMNTVKDQRTLENARREALSLGYTQDEINQNLPSVYDEKTIGFVREQLGQASIPYQEKIEQDRKAQEAAARFKQLEFDNNIALANLNLSKQKAAAEAAKPKLSVGQETLDKKFADDLNDWAQDGRKQSISDVAQLKAVVENLKNGKGTTGGLTGIGPDRVTSADVLSNRATVKKAALPLIKRFLSGATSDSDREAVINTLWNESDSTENNMARISEFAENMGSRIQNMDDMAKFFRESGGTLKDYKMSTNEQTQSAPPAPTPGLEKRGYIFMGGDPSDQKNWKKK